MQDATTVTDYDYVTYLEVTAHKSLWELVGRTLHRKNATMQLHVFSQPAMFGAEDGEIIAARIESGSTGNEALVYLRRIRAAATEASMQRIAMQRQSDAAIHAARIYRQAEEIRAKSLK